jgi:hypothetical protein
METYNDFSALVDELESLVRQKILVISGITEDKHQLLLRMAENAYIISCALYAYAAKKGSAEIMHQVSFTVDQIMEHRAYTSASICSNIHELAQMYLPDLEAWCIGEDDLHELQADIDLFISICPAPIAAVKHRTVLTANIREKVLQIDYCRKNRLDMSVNRLMKVSSKFVSEYHLACKLINIGIHRSDNTIIIGTGSEAVA